MRCPTLNELPAPPPGRTGWPWTEESSQCPDHMPDGLPWPRVSVVTPSYNQGRFIEEAIRSVLLQGYPNLEFMIIDGGSTDGSVETIRSYAPWLSYWVSEPDRGQTHAINKGWARAAGELLAYINTDDLYLAGGVAAAAQAFHANPDVGMVYGPAIVIDEANRLLRVWQARPFDVKVMLTEGNTVPQPAAFFARDALERVGYLDETWNLIMDYELCIRLGLQFPAICLAETLARFRDHAQSKSRSRFDAIAGEVLHLLNAFDTDQVSPSDLRAIKRVAASRVHYELAMAYLAEGLQQAPKGLTPFLRSVLLYPPFALNRPLQTTYAMKELVLSHLMAIGISLPSELRHAARTLYRRCQCRRQRKSL